MFECPDAAALVQLVDGELTNADAEAVRVHLEACDACRTAVARLVVARGRTQGGDAPVDTPEPAEGERFADRYRIVGRLGRGGMGTVFEAWDPVLERRVALKLIRLRRAIDPTTLTERLLRESRALAKLRHPNVVAVYDVGTSQGRPYLAMEYVAGQTLRRWLESSSRSWREVLDVFEQAGRGLAAAHARGLVHRDFKPDNVIIREHDDPHGRVVVLDFGLVRAAAEPSDGRIVVAAELESRASTLTESGHIVGTPAYMAPEQFEGGDIDARADVFAYCVALFEALHGARPFAGADLPGILAAIAAGDVQRPPSARSVPAWLDAAIVAGLAADRERRPADLRALLVRLRPPRRRWAWAFAGLVPVVAVAWAMRPSPAEDARCTEDPLARTWHETTRAAIDTALAQVGGSTRTHVLGTLDDHAAALRSAWTTACDVRERDPTRAALELGCLDGARQGFVALTRVLAEGDLAAIPAVDTLASVDACAADPQLGASMPLPPEPERRAEVAAVRGELAQLQMLHEVGRGDEARARVEELSTRVAAIDYPPLSANAAYLRAQLLLSTGDLGGAKATMVEAAQIATAAQFDPLAAQAWVDLVFIAAEPMRDFERAHEYDGNARAAIARLADGTPKDQLESRRAGHFGRLLVREGDVVGGRRELAHSLALAESLATANDDRTSREFVVDALEALAFADGEAGDFEASIAAYELVLARRIELLGPEHPRTAMTHGDLGGVLADAGKLEPALAHNRTARELYERVLGPDDPNTGIALGNEARLLGRLGRNDEALAAYDRVLAIAERTEGPDGYFATRTRENRARVLVAAGRPQDAIPELERALGRLESGELGLDRADVAQCLLALGEAWLAAGEPARAHPLLTRGLAEPGVDPLLAARLRLAAGLAAAGTAVTRGR